jgi:hypothetical protein
MKIMFSRSFLRDPARSADRCAKERSRASLRRWMAERAGPDAPGEAPP